MKRSRPRQHKRKLKSGKVIIVNKGRKKTAKRRMPLVKKTGVPNIDYNTEYKGNVDNTIVKMDPKDFLKEVKRQEFNAFLKRGDVDRAKRLMDMSVEEWTEGYEDVNTEGKPIINSWKEDWKLDRIRKGHKQGKNIPGLYLTYNDDGETEEHEGRHRALVAIERGDKEVPVNKVTSRRLIPNENSFFGNWDMSKKATFKDTIPGEFEGEIDDEEE